MVYHFPENNKYGWGGTNNSEIGYSYKNFVFASQDEWQQYKIPHVSGYIEEMAHSFVHATKTQFGWEMVGWSIGIEATQKVASNPIFLRQLKETRKKQAITFARYKKGGYLFPKDVAANKCDRIYAYLLWKGKLKYGRKFWPDFFKEIRKEYVRLCDAAKLGNPDKNRNKRYQIVVDCFDRLEGLDFKTMLKTEDISLVTDVKALHPEEPEWDGRFISSDPVNNIVYDIHSDLEKSPEKEISQGKPLVDTNSLPSLHRAVYGGHNEKTKRLIQKGVDLNERGPNEWTPLHMAAIGGHRLLAEYLLNKGAGISMKDKSGRDAAKLAEVFGHTGLAKFLRKREEK